jgi:catechol 2,3-dioxygenase-like lactoylglutathione lyase family enzyme
MASPTKLAHVVYMTRRFDEMISWYKRVFEAKVQYQNPAFAFLTYSVSNTGRAWDVVSKENQPVAYAAVREFS